MRKEVRLTRAEMGQKASRVGKNVGFLGVGGVVVYTGVLALVAALILVLVVSAVGAFLMGKGANTLRREGPAPRETVETLKEDGEWLKNQTNR